MLICLSVKVRCDLPFLPLALAASNPALVRSRIKSRSNSAIAPKTWKNQSSAAGGGIQALLNALEPNTPITQSPHDFNEMPQRATQAIEFPDYQDVTFSGVV
jgi:hypothetical protein